MMMMMIAGICQRFRTERSAVTQSLARRKIISTSHYNGSSNTVSRGARVNRTPMSFSNPSHHGHLRHSFACTARVLATYPKSYRVFVT
jgi:hypothetical protein